MPHLPDRHRVRLEEVAAAAGVSRTSASRVMLGQRKVSDETRRRVLAAAERLGYVANVAASELASGGSSTVGLLLRDASNPAYGLLFTELQKAAHDADITLLTMTIQDDAHGAQQVASLHRLMGMRVAGLIVATGGVASEQLEPFATRVPIIRAGRPESSGRIHAVSYDETDAALRLADHIISLGHTRVAVLTAREEDSYPEFVRSTVMAEALECHGARVHRIEYTPEHAALDDTVALVRYGAVTAVMVPSDLRQLHLIRALQAAGLSVPGDVSTTGCDGILPGADLLGLTTMRIAVEDVAQRTIEHIGRMIRDLEASPAHTPSVAGGAVVNERITGTFIAGRTAAPPPHT